MRIVKNPVHELGIAVFRVTWRKDKTTNERVIVTGYRPQGETCYAWNGYSDEVLAKAGGYGYDKTSSALKVAIQKLAGWSLDVNGAAGCEAVVKAAAKHGIKVTEVA